MRATVAFSSPTSPSSRATFALSAATSPSETSLFAFGSAAGDSVLGAPASSCAQRF
jgi:hypothetical protein